MSISRRLGWYLVGIAILISGLTGAAWIIETTPDAEDGAIGYRTIGGRSYPILPEDSKRYEAELERFGGKFAVQTAKLDRWLAARWHGKQLGYTIGFLAVVTGMICLLIGRFASEPPGDEAGSPGDARNDAP